MAIRSLLRSQITNAEWYDSFLAGNNPTLLGVAGYAAGGSTGSLVSTVDKFAFPSDSRTTLATGLSSARQRGTGFFDTNVAGYVAAGSDTTTVDKFAFPSDSRTTLATGLSDAVRELGGFSDAGVAGYALGGRGPGGTRTTVDKFAFPSDSRTSLATGISSSRYDLVGFANPAVAGYGAGGDQGGAVDTVDKFAFPGDTRTTLGTGLATPRRATPASFAHPAVAGYVGGGVSDTNATIAAVDKFAFPSDSRTTLGTGLSITRRNLTGFADPAVGGYASGGFDDNTSTLLNTVDKFAFPSDSRTTLGTGLSAARSGLMGFQDA